MYDRAMSENEEDFRTSEKSFNDCGFGYTKMILLLVGVLIGAVIALFAFYIVKRVKTIRKKDEEFVEEEENGELRKGSKGSNHLRISSSRRGSARPSNFSGSSRKMSKTQSLLEQELRRSPMTTSSSTSARNNGCLNCKLIIMGESISYADGRCPQCGDDQEQRRMK